MVVGGQHTERHRHSGFERDLLQARARFSGDVIEVRRVAANHRAQRDDAVIAMRVRQHFRRQGKLKRSRHEKHVEAFGARFVQASRAPSSSFSVIVRVEARHHDRERSPRRVEIASNCIENPRTSWDN